MKKTTKIILGIIGAFAFAGIAFAASTVFVNTVQTSSNPVATSTIVYMTPGTATTTLTYDSYPSGVSATNGAALFLQVTASSTATKYLINEEYSQDGIDWYQGTFSSLNGYATTTIPTNISQIPQWIWTYASSTPGLGAVTASVNTDARMIHIQTPTRFIRVIITMTGANGAIWAQLVPQKTQPQ